MFLSRCLAPLATRRENLWAEYQSEKSLEVTASEKTFSSCAMCKPVRKNQCNERLKLIEPPPWTLSLNSLKYAINRQIRQLSAFIEIVSGVRIFLHLKAKKNVLIRGFDIKKMREHIDRSCCSHQDTNIAFVFEPGQILAKNDKSITVEMLIFETAVN